MKIGIYISGLGQSVENDSVEKYAERLKNEFKFNTRGVNYHTKSEKVTYVSDREATVVTLYEGSGFNTILYRFYEFRYHELLTEKFKKKSVISKSLWLLNLVLVNFPVVIKRIFSPQSYARPLQTFYLFLIFLLISLFLVITLVAAVDVVRNTPMIQETFLAMDKNNFYINSQYFTAKDINTWSQIIVSLVAFTLLFIPNANTLITNLATEFVCANDYIRHGARRQIIQGNLEHLVDYISEHEKSPEIHFHTYSFGSILAIDYLYPYRTKPSGNAMTYCKALITIGSPYEFINSYFKNFYNNRITHLGDNIQWVNIYSVSDALSTNFRNDACEGDAQFGVKGALVKPDNLSYEITSFEKEGIVSFIMLRSLQAHNHYWDQSTEGSGCQSLIYGWMRDNTLLSDNLVYLRA